MSDHNVFMFLFVFAKFVLLFLCPHCNHGDGMFCGVSADEGKQHELFWQTRSPSAPSPPPPHSSVMKTSLFLWRYWLADRQSDPGLPAPTRRGLGLAASRRGTSRIGCLTSPSSKNGPERNQKQSPVQQNSRFVFMCWTSFSQSSSQNTESELFTVLSWNLLKHFMKYFY